MDPTALFAAQYAEAVKLRKGIDPIIEHYETLKSAYFDQEVLTNQTVDQIRKLIEQRALQTPLPLHLKKPIMVTNPSTGVPLVTYGFS